MLKDTLIPDVTALQRQSVQPRAQGHKMSSRPQAVNTDHLCCTTEEANLLQSGCSAAQRRNPEAQQHIQNCTGCDYVHASYICCKHICRPASIAIFHIPVITHLISLPLKPSIAT